MNTRDDHTRNRIRIAAMVNYLHSQTTPEDRVTIRNMSAVHDGLITRIDQLEKLPTRLNPTNQHPPPMNSRGKVLAKSIEDFCENHTPEIRYNGRRTAIDALTSCRAPNGEEYSFHYRVRYTKNGIYIRKVSGTGFPTSAEETEAMRRNAGLPPFVRKSRRKMLSSN